MESEEVGDEDVDGRHEGVGEGDEDGGEVVVESNEMFPLKNVKIFDDLQFVLIQKLL
jgi:hypothetical protein